MTRMQGGAMGRARCGLILVVGLLAGVLVAPARATFPGRNGSVIATFEDGTRPFIRAISPSGGSARTVFSCAINKGGCPDVVGGVGVSSDGKLVAFEGTTFPDVHVSQTQLWVLDLGSRQAHALPAALAGLGGPGSQENDVAPAWFPGARRLLFDAELDGSSVGLYRAGSDGGNVVRLSSCVCSGGRVSPDGKLIVFERGSDIWTARSDGSVPRLLATNAEQPSWSPGGRRVAFVSLARGTDLATVGLNGRHRRVLAHNALSPVWSPDGRLIAFDHCTRCLYNDSRSEIMTVRSSGGATKTLFRDNPHGGAGVWALDWQALPR